MSYFRPLHNVNQHSGHIIKLLQQAGLHIMDVYQGDNAELGIEMKSDQSPLTIADKRSHDFLIDHLSALDKSIPIMSEESAAQPYEERRLWNRYWCLDPLDGTKEFIKRNDQFTINLALMENNHPVMGFIHLPVSGETYWASRGLGAFRHAHGKSLPIQANRNSLQWTAVSSGSHASADELEFLSRFPIVQHLRAGSALKFCWIASGKADVYYRSGPTMEWDTAAGHVLVEEAGALFEYVQHEKSLHYNKPNLLNPAFFVRIQ